MCVCECVCGGGGGGGVMTKVVKVTCTMYIPNLDPVSAVV